MWIVRAFFSLCLVHLFAAVFPACQCLYSGRRLHRTSDGLARRGLTSTIGWCVRAEDGPLTHVSSRSSGHRHVDMFDGATGNGAVDDGGLAVWE